MEYYAVIKKNEIMPHAATWMDPESIILSKVIQAEKIIWHHLYVESNKNDTNEPIYKTETNSQISKSNVWSLKGKHKSWNQTYDYQKENMEEGVINWEIAINTYMLTIYRIDDNCQLTV